MGKRIGRGTRRYREQRRQERAIYDAHTLEMREKSRLADEAAVAVREEYAAKAEKAGVKTKELTDRLVALGHEINPVRSIFSHNAQPNLFFVSDDALEKLIVALSRSVSVGEAG